MEIERRLEQMGHKLPQPPVPAANYIGYVRVGNLLFIGGNGMPDRKKLISKRKVASSIRPICKLI